MIFCPFCGVKQRKQLLDGINSCDNCARVYDTSKSYKLLSAAWACRKWHLYDIEIIKKQCSLNQEESDFIQKHILDGCLSHDEFLKMVAI